MSSTATAQAPAKRRDMPYGHKYDDTTNHHIGTDPLCRIECEWNRHNDASPWYPVLHVGRVTFFPTVDQLRDLAGEIDRSLAAGPPDDEPAPSIHDEPHVPAEASGSCGGGCHLCPADPAENVETAELVIPPPMIDPTDALTIRHNGEPVYSEENPF